LQEARTTSPHPWLAANGTSAVLDASAWQQSANGHGAEPEWSSDDIADFINAMAMQHCPTCRAVFMPARTGMEFCSGECRRNDPRPHRFETARKETERAAALRVPKLPGE
jgi:hypothetical protein